jgi:hypothetical protein
MEYGYHGTMEQINEEKTMKKVNIDGQEIEIEGDTATIHIYYMPGFDNEKLQTWDPDKELVYPKDCGLDITEEEFNTMEVFEKWDLVYNSHIISREEFYSKDCRECTCNY